VNLLHSLKNEGMGKNCSEDVCEKHLHPILMKDIFKNGKSLETSEVDFLLPLLSQTSISRMVTMR
jgi:hypothetical protein